MNDLPQKPVTDPELVASQASPPLTLRPRADLILKPVMSEHNGAVVRASGLTKIYEGRPVVDAIDLRVDRGECFGILGPNGAGKTTTLRMLIGTTPPSGGRLEVLGLAIPDDARLMRRRIGVVPQGDNLDPDFTVTENLAVYGS